jgi:hypothetical protein
MSRCPTQCFVNWLPSTCPKPVHLLKLTRQKMIIFRKHGDRPLVFIIHHCLKFQSQIQKLEWDCLTAQSSGYCSSRTTIAFAELEATCWLLSSLLRSDGVPGSDDAPFWSKHQLLRCSPEISYAASHCCRPHLTKCSSQSPRSGNGWSLDFSLAQAGWSLVLCDLSLRGQMKSFKSRDSQYATDDVSKLMVRLQHGSLN